ncbi:MAG TPA: proline--tRNA ligase [Nitrospinaceae bacterium]|jgi:prolyl-tRNA synthetase|nr:proline--tRNA ligase [Nitrospinaceae bacterium]HJN99615.1 proline--tRNA ligase [Nitrospinaceae bacterium]|tara:strand:+ start:2780 stop:4489 length:1710 start_codon:yes stop_codon:yes gene_type:complete
MYYSKILIPTLKESPADAEVISHKLMVRAGMIRQMAAGIYSTLPLGLRVFKKVEQIIREEMNRIGGQEVFLPSVQPAELWEESGRWEFYGKELLRLKDRHDREFCYGPTHEEIITDIVRRDVHSYRQLPITLYQIQTKFRDEVRPRFGIMRGREFTMKDAYSFHTTEESTRETYSQMAEAYSRIFERCGLDFKMVEADSGTIGGSFSHEFVVLADSGEDRIGFCDSCDYASNLEKAEARAAKPNNESTSEEDIKEVPTPGKKSVEEVTQFLNVSSDKLIKTIVFETDQGLVAGLVRGDREINPVKLKNLIDCEWLNPAPEELITKETGVPCGYLGPVGVQLKVFADTEIKHMSNGITGANKADTHLTGVQFGRDLKVEKVGDLKDVNEGDRCPKCDSGKYKIKRGIEVGHIFILGAKYSEAMKAHYLDDQGKEKPMIMGCYGIGVGRTAAAAIEQNYDEKGIIWPLPLAPFQAVILPVNFKVDAVRSAAETIYKTLWEQGVETLLDDRSDRLGVKFKDAELLGIPLQIIIGPKNLDEGKVELKSRKTGESKFISFPGEISTVPEILAEL